MAISIFPSTAAEFVSNNFVVDMNDTSNNSVTLENVKQAGTYNISIESGDNSFDIYLLDNDGALVAYTNSTTVAPTGLFQIVVVLGVADSEIISFSYAGNVNNPDGEGDQPGAAAYLESISPTDLPSIDDTATITGGNFGADTEITFESGATVLPAKSITVSSSTELLVTRPDGLIEDDAPYTVRAVTTGVPEPTGTNANLLVDEVTAGSDPTWVTTSPLNPAGVGSSFSQTLEATDSDGTVVDYSVTAGTITPGLSLNSSTGEISGTATTAGTATFTVTATDDGGNTTDREFTQEAGSGVSGGSTFSSGGFEYNLFTSSDDITIFTETEIEYLVIAGGGGSGGATNPSQGGGGGGAGGLLSGTATISPTTSTITIGAGGAAATNGNNTIAPLFGTAIGGGLGNDVNQDGGDGGSGGGAGGGDNTGGTGTAGQGFDGGDTSGGGSGSGGGGGGGATEAGQDGVNATPGDGGDGSNAFSTWATAVSLVIDGGYFAGGGGGGVGNNVTPGGDAGLGGGASGGVRGQNGNPGIANSGGGAGGSGSTEISGSDRVGANGGSGVVIVRYAS